MNLPDFILLYTTNKYFITFMRMLTFLSGGDMQTISEQRLVRKLSAFLAFDIYMKRALNECLTVEHAYFLYYFV